MPRLGGGEWLVIILVVVLLFGAKRLPDAARSVGRSLRIFKAETKGLIDEPTPAPPVAGPVPGSVTGTPTVAAPAVDPSLAPTTEVPPKA